MNANIVKSEIFIEKLKYESICDLIIEGLNTNSDENLIIDCELDRKWTKRQVLDSCQNFAYYLINDCKLCKGDVVCFVGHSSDIHVIGFLGVILAGGVYSSLPTPTTEYEIKSFVECLKPALVVCDHQYYNVMTDELKMNKNILLIEHAQTRPTTPALDVIIKVKRAPTVPLPVQTGHRDWAVILMTSGSTGAPKAIVKTHANLLWTLSSVKIGAGINANEVTMVNSRLNQHSINKIIFTVNTIGAQIAILRTFGIDVMYKYIHRYGITSLSLPPTILDQLLKYCYFYNKNYVNSLCNVMVGGATTPDSTYEFILNNYTFEYFMNDYGLTETGHVAFAYMKNGSNFATIGKPYPNTAMKIVDECDNALPANTRGEICIRSGQITPGYLHNTPAENARLFTADGFFRSGDIGYYDDRHDFYIVGRIKHFISVNATLIAPAELEHILHTHSDVSMAAVIGIPSDECGEVPLAFVTLIEGATATVPQLIEYVNSRVTDLKQLKGGLRVLDAFPMTHTDKVNKVRLLEMAVSSRDISVCVTNGKPVSNGSAF